MDVIAISGQKGGSGRSSSAYAIGAALAEYGRRVLMVDCDPQGSLTAACGVNAAGASLAEVLAGSASLTDTLYEVAPGLDLAPADIALANVELWLVTAMGRENKLKRALTAVPLPYDLIVIDCPPSLGVLTINALVAADGVIVPLKPESNDIRAMSLFVDTLGRVRDEGLNPHLELIGILPVMVDDRLIHHQNGLQVLHDAGLPIFGVNIGRSVSVPEAAADYKSITTYAPDHKITAAYRAVAQEITQWQQRRRNRH